jgi:hypothetical protein
VLFVLSGVAGYVVAVSLARLDHMPWYLPGLATVGVLLMAASAWQRPGVLRFVGLGFFVLLCATEWLFVGVLFKTPAYQGPAVPGSKLPAFTATLADGRPFSNADVKGSQATLLIFFRGRW